jgi:hypothetical protein
MKTFAHYDERGNVRALISVNAPERITLALTPKPGQLVAEVEGVEISPGPPDVDALRSAAKTLQIAGSLPRCVKR